MPRRDTRADACLGDLISTELRVVGVLRTWSFVGAGGRDLGRLKIERSPIGRLLDKQFVRRIGRLDVEGRDLETVWRVTIAGDRHVADVVHLFPYNLLPVDGSPPGRGYEVRAPGGEVYGFTDQTRRVVRPNLVYRDGTGADRVVCEGNFLRTRLTFEAVGGGALLDLGRQLGSREGWRASWVSKRLEGELRDHLAGCLIVALLWSGGI